jgi:hypothetical protein
MTTHASSTPQQDLAFLRGITDNSSQWAGGQVFFVAGLIYGAQCLVHWSQAMGWLRISTTLTLVLSFAPSVVFLIYVLGVMLRRRPASSGPAGAAVRAVGGAFSAAGLANLVMMAVFAINAWRRHDLLVWELYPAVVFAMQGAAWILVFLVRRRAWHLWVGLGWLVSATVLGLLIGTTAYVLAVAVSLLLLMALPGWVMMRLARQAA